MNAVAGPVRIGIDLGGTGTRFVAVDESGAVVARSAFATPTGIAPDAARSFLVQHARAVASGRPIVAVTASLSMRTGAALFEAHCGAAAGYDSVLMVTLGTGVGVAALQPTGPVRGADGTHPEAGHLSVTGAEAPCYCGRAACWEQLVSRAALQRAAGSVLPSPTGTPADIDTAAEMAARSDPDAVAVFDAFGRHLAEGLADLLTVFRSSCVVLGGSAAKYRPAYGPALERRLAHVDVYRATPPVLVSAAGDFGGAIGAALLGPG